jgi:hypothetical protein
VRAAKQFSTTFEGAMNMDSDKLLKNIIRWFWWIFNQLLFFA